MKLLLGKISLTDCETNSQTSGATHKTRESTKPKTQELSAKEKFRAARLDAHLGPASEPKVGFVEDQQTYATLNDLEAKSDELDELAEAARLQKLEEER